MYAYTSCLLNKLFCVDHLTFLKLHMATQQHLLSSLPHPPRLQGVVYPKNMNIITYQEPTIVNGGVNIISRLTMPASMYCLKKVKTPSGLAPFTWYDLRMYRKDHMCTWFKHKRTTGQCLYGCVPQEGRNQVAVFSLAVCLVWLYSTAFYAR